MLLYLDIDNVLNDERCYDEASEDPKWDYNSLSNDIVFRYLLNRVYIGRINRLCAEHKLSIVVCSELRWKVPIQQTLKNAGLSAPILGVTPKAPGKAMRGTVQDTETEILLDIKERGVDVNAIAILTDESAALGTLENRAVRCEDGVTEEDIAELLSLF